MCNNHVSYADVYNATLKKIYQLDHFECLHSFHKKEAQFCLQFKNNASLGKRKV